MEESEPIQKNAWLQDAATKGFILAVIHIVIFLIIYFFMPNKLTGFSYLFVVLFLNLIYTFVNAKGWRKQIGGYIDFGDAFKYGFVLLAVSGIIQSLFSFVFLLIEPSFPETMAQSQLDTSIYWAQKFGAPDDALEQMTERFDPEEVTKRFTFMGQLMGFGIVLLLYAIGAAIVGLVVKKSEPVQF